MIKKKVFISLFTITLTFLVGWKVAKMTSKSNELNTVNQAVPVVRFDHFDRSRNSLVIGLFNPGRKTMEINRTELVYKRENKTVTVASDYKNNMDKPLVLDPGDTILIPLQQKINVMSRKLVGDYWGKLDFKIPGQADFFSLHHKFNNDLFSEKKSSID